MPDGKTEGSYYSPLEIFLKAHLPGVATTSQETAPGKIGIPDITVRYEKSGKKIGWIEVKTPDEKLSASQFKEQFDKYKHGLENIIFTNFREWQLWQWKDGESRITAEILCDISNFSPSAEDQLEKLLKRFMESGVAEITTAKQLTLALARKAKLLSQQVKENFDENDKDSPLTRAKNMFGETLIENIDTDKFADMMAQTLTYSLLLAALEGNKSGNDFTLRTAVDFLPKNVPVLGALYDVVLKTSKKVPEIQDAAEWIIDQLQVEDLSGILQELNKGKPGDDVGIHFYEPFLKEYDPDKKKKHGVYYTPKAVVDFIVGGTDYLLEKHFGKTDGLADKQVKILDPAVGTGAFLLSAMETVRQKTYDKYKKTGIGAEKFKEAAANHILKNFYGFELMVAPYAVAHLKLTLELKKMGFDITSASKDSRLQIYIANTLDDPDLPPRDLYGFEEITKEGEMAKKIKKDTPILAIIGNPPYANYGKMNQQTWIIKLLDEYKENLNEKKTNLNDDYIKFIRFAQWKIEGERKEKERGKERERGKGKGIFAMITANSFLDGITHRRMRESILKTFDEIYIYNLHGNMRKGETSGGDDENIFENVGTGVSINIFVKNKEKKNKGDYCKVLYASAGGMSRAKKYATLAKQFKKVIWDPVDYRGFNKAFALTKWGEELGDLNFFVPGAGGEVKKIPEYGEFWGLKDIFGKPNSGIQTKRDHLTIQFGNDALQAIIKDFAKMDTETIRAKYNLPADGDGWKIDWAQKDLNENKKQIVDIDFRPFDVRKTIFTRKTGGFLARPRTQTMQHMLKPNLALISERMFSYQADISVTCSKNIVDAHLVGGNSYVFPLYTYPDENELTVTDIDPSNISTDFKKAIMAKLGKKPSPEDIFYYVYAVLHCPGYRRRYAEFSKIDFPRIPLTGDKKLFGELSQLGNELVNLHLLGENPFDNSDGIFDTPDKWKIKIDGKKPPDVDDWEIGKIEYKAAEERVYINKGQYFEGIDEATWEFMVGAYKPLDKWLKERKKANMRLTTEDKEHYMKIAVSLRETQKIMKKIDTLIPNWQTFLK